jgi:hypothetical protein
LYLVDESRDLEPGDLLDLAPAELRHDVPIDQCFPVVFGAQAGPFELEVLLGDVPERGGFVGLNFAAALRGGLYPGRSGIGGLLRSSRVSLARIDSTPCQQGYRNRPKTEGD